MSLKSRYSADISDICFYPSSPFSIMENFTTPTFKNKRKLEKFLDDWRDSVTGILVIL